jgi:hypothetical protein
MHEGQWRVLSDEYDNTRIFIVKGTFIVHKYQNEYWEINVSNNLYNIRRILKRSSRFDPSESDYRNVLKAIWKIAENVILPIGSVEQALAGLE